MVMVGSGGVAKGSSPRLDIPLISAHLFKPPAARILHEVAHRNIALDAATISDVFLDLLGESFWKTHTLIFF